MTAMLLAALLLPAGQVPATPATAPPQLVRVFVLTDDFGDAAELAGRRDSVKDLRDALADKKKTVAIVSEKDGADVVIEVVDRAVTVPKVVFGGVGPAAGPAGTGPAGPVKAVHLKVKLTYGKELLPFANKNAPTESSGGWKAAAEDIAKQLDKWIAAHREALLAGRGGLANSASVH